MSRPFPARSFKPREPLHRRNGKIRARTIRVLDEHKQQVGVMSLDEGLRLARSKGLDLVEIAPTANPPVCRIVDYGKFLFELSKSAPKHPAAGRMKEIQLSANIDPHDLSVKLHQAIQFLCDDMKVRVKLRFRGRQKAHKEIGQEIVNKFLTELAPYGHAEAPPQMAGDRDLNVLINPLSRTKRAKNPREGQAPPEAPPPETPPPANSAS